MKDLDQLLSAYADGELDPETVLEVEQLIATNPAARQKAEMHREVSALMRAACSDRAYAGSVAQVLDRPRTTASGRQFGWAIAASVIFGVLGFGGGTAWTGFHTSARDAAVSEVADYHSVFARETLHLAEVPANQPDHIKAWLGRRLDHPFAIPDLSSAKLTFAGARMLVIDGRPVADLLFTREGGLPVAYCIFRLDGKAVPLQADHKGDYNLVSWGDGTLGYVVVGDVETDALRGIADRIKQQTAS